MDPPAAEPSGSGTEPDPTPPPPASPPPTPPAAVSASAAAAAAASSSSPSSSQPSRYESQKRRDWNTFLQYLRNHKPPLSLPRCSGAHVIEFLKYLDQFGKTKVHAQDCPYFGHPNPPAPCPCPLRQAWGSLDALIGRLRAAYEESGGRPDSNPFATSVVRIYLREVRESQAKARGIPYEKKKRKRHTGIASSSSSSASASASASTSSASASKPSEKTGEGSGNAGGGV